MVAFVLLRNSRFNFHCYTQRETTPTEKSARKWQLRPFATSCVKAYEGHSLVQTSPVGITQMVFLHLFLFVFIFQTTPGCMSVRTSGHSSFRIAINQWYFSEVDMYTYGEAYVNGAGHYYQVLTWKDILELSGTGVRTLPQYHHHHTSATEAAATTAYLALVLWSKAPQNGQYILPVRWRI